MSKNNQTLSTRSTAALMTCIGFSFYGLLSLGMFIQDGYVILRYKLTDPFIAISVICIAFITAIISGMHFRDVRAKDLRNNE